MIIYFHVQIRLFNGVYCLIKFPFESQSHLRLKKIFSFCRKIQATMLKIVRCKVTVCKLSRNRWNTLSFLVCIRRRESIKRSASVLHVQSNLLAPLTISRENETARVQFHKIKGSRANSSSATTKSSNPHRTVSSPSSRY